MTLLLTTEEQAMLAGERGAARRTAMRILTRMADVYGAAKLIEIESAHIDGCLFHGASGVEFAERLVLEGARVQVPTTLNVGGVDRLHPELFRGDEQHRDLAERLMTAYEDMGCKPTWSCAPYQCGHRPALGAQVAWAESNAIVFVNSVLGARTERYGDFIDICAALTARAPAVGLHLSENRRGQVVFDLAELPEGLLKEDVLYPVLGYLIGALSGSEIPVIDGLPAETSEDQLKALGAAAASSGAVAMFHAVGVTPEAPSLEAALHGEAPDRIVRVGADEVREARSRLSTVEDMPRPSLSAVALGSPHYSLEEFERLMPLVRRYPPAPSVEFYVCTHRWVWDQLQSRDWDCELRDLGIRVVVDTCVVVTPILEARKGVLMTNSGKFAHYTPGNTGLQVLYGSLEECVRSAQLGQLWRDTELWSLTA